MIDLVASSGLDAQNKLAELVAKTKTEDPFRHITLIVESNHQGLQFRRQLVRSLDRIGAPNALIAFSAVTKFELLSNIAGACGIDWDSESYEKSRQSCLEKVLLSKGDYMAKLAKHPESLEKIMQYTRHFDWLVLTEEYVEAVNSEGNGLFTQVSQDLLRIAFETQGAIRELGQKSPADVCRQLEAIDGASVMAKIGSILGLVFSLTSSHPKTLERVVSHFVDEQSHVRLNLQAFDSQATGAQVLSSPDPETEAKIAVRGIAKRLAEGASVDQMAILYSDSAQYADLIAHELDSAEINWHGIATESPLTTRVAAASKSFFEIIVSLWMSGSFSRADLFALFKAGKLRIQGVEINPSSLEKFVKRNSFFNSVQNWLPQLTNTFEELASLRKELEDLVSQQMDQELISRAEFRIRDSEEAGVLLTLIGQLSAIGDRLQGAESDFDLGSSFWTELNDLCPSLADARMPMEKLCFTRLEESFLSQAKTGITPGPESLSRLISIHQSVTLTLSKLRMQHGEQSRGIYVGPITQNGALFFIDLWILGAGDGYLPPAVNEDPIFPDHIKQNVREVTGEVFLLVGERVLEIENNFFAVASGATNLSVSYARAGTLSRSEGEASPWLKRLTPSVVEVVNAAKEFRLGEPHAITRGDLRSKLSAASQSLSESFSQALKSAVWFADPHPSKFVGDLSDLADSQLIDFSSVVLSASYVEKFLKCQHNFFTVRLLGISDMEDADNIEDVRAIDFGKSVHKALERLLKDWPGLSPSFGEPYSSAAREKFVEIFSEECDLLIDRGQAGWLPLFNVRKRRFIDLVDVYFEYEYIARSTTGSSPGKKPAPQMSDSNQLRPQFAEFPFNEQGEGSQDLTVSPENAPPQVLRFRGVMDRVDVSEDGEHVSVVDFKTGKRSRFDPETAVQDLLYERAVRHSTQFVGVRRVSTKYLFLAKTEKDSGVLEIRGNRDRRVFLPESDGGLTGQELQDVMTQNRLNSEEELNKILSRIVEAAFVGHFPTHNTTESANSFDFCATCARLGKKRIAQLSRLVNGKVQKTEIETEDEI